MDDGIYSSPYLPSNLLDPVEREYLLIFDKDFFQEEELYMEDKHASIFHCSNLM